MKFKDFFQETQILHEISREHVNKLPKNVTELLTNKKLPFNSIFGDKLRIVEPLKGGKEYKLNISKQIGDNYDIDYDKWVGYKISDKEKKNPIRLGKILSKRKQEVEKWIKDAQTEESKRAYHEMLSGIDQLLKTTNLQKQVADAEQTSLYVVLSRAPIDVVRMGDMNFKNYSCHSPKGDYFYCALADAMLNAGVAYLITEEDYEINRLNVDENLQVDEIFLDNDRNVEGLGPVARIRIRLVLDEDGNELAVPTTKIYAKSGYEFNDDFKSHMISWAKKQNTESFNWDSTLKLKGGSYEDYDYTISKQVKLIWGKDVDYSISGDDSEFQDDANDEDGVYEEYFYDQVVYELDGNEDEEIFNNFWGGDGSIGESESGISISISHRNRINFSFEIPRPVIDIIGKDVLETATGKNVDGWVLEKRSANFYFDSYADAPNLLDYGSWWGQDDGGDFDYDGYYEECRDTIESKLDSFSSESYQDELEEKAFNYRYGFNRRVLEIFGKEVDESEPYEKIISEFLDPDHYGDETLLLEDFELNHIQLYATRDNIQNNNTVDSFRRDEYNVVLSAMDTVKLKTAVHAIENHIFKIIDEKFPKVLEQDGISFEFSLVLPGEKAPDISYFFNDFFTEFNQRNKKITTITSTIKYPVVNFKLIHEMSDYENLASIIDEMKLQEVYKAVKTISEMDEDDKEAFLKLDLLQQQLRQNRSREFYDELKRQGQMELDLSSINRNMAKKQTVFDKVYNNILLELDFSKGGISNQSGVQSQGAGIAPAGVNAKPNTGTQMKFAGKPKFSPTTPGAANQTQAQTSTNPQQQQQDPAELEYFQNLLTLRQTNPAQFQTDSKKLSQDPDSFNRFLDFATQQVK